MTILSILGIITAIILTVIIILTIIILVHRKYSHREIDDVHPEIPMSKEIFDDSKWLWVIPLYAGKPISEYKNWCEKIKKSGKLLGMHGVKHTFDEFNHDITPEYVQEGMDEFKKGFGYYPKYFKAPKLHITKNNRKIIKDRGMILKGHTNQLLHKVYHTGESIRKKGYRLPFEI
jgi:predicted deacetylase